jgi:hypothetical protein
MAVRTGSGGPSNGQAVDGRLIGRGSALRGIEREIECAARTGAKARRWGRSVTKTAPGLSERETLTRYTRRATTAQALALRMRVVPRCAEGETQTAVVRIWKAFALQQHRTETFKLSKAPLFVERVRGIV